MFVFSIGTIYLHLFLYHQVPADGVLISGHSLAIDESSMTGESKTVSFYGKSLGCSVSMANLLVVSYLPLLMIHGYYF
jgi:high-affinity K+ transport system ATPase subunit B